MDTPEMDTPEPEQQPTPPQQSTWLFVLIAFTGVLAVLAWVTVTVVASRTEDQRDAAVAQSLSLAQQVRRACAAGGSGAAELAEMGACRAAAQVQASPIRGPAGPPGVSGERGRPGFTTAGLPARGIPAADHLARRTHGFGMRDRPARSPDDRSPDDRSPDARPTATRLGATEQYRSGARRPVATRPLRAVVSGPPWPFRLAADSTR